MKQIYDKDGIVDDYVLFYLRALKRLEIQLIIVCNGILSQNGKKDLEKFVRKNEYIIPLDHYIYSSLQPDLFLSNLEILVDDILHSALT